MAPQIRSEKTLIGTLGITLLLTVTAVIFRYAEDPLSWAESTVAKIEQQQPGLIAPLPQLNPPERRAEYSSPDGSDPFRLKSGFQ